MSEITSKARRRVSAEACNVAAPLVLALLATMGCGQADPAPAPANETGGGTSGGATTGGSSSSGTGGTSSPTGGTGGASGSPTGGTGGSTMPPDCSAPKLGGSPLRRLTRREYNNVVGALLGDTTRPADAFVPESAQSGFTNGAESTLLSSVVIDDFERAATALAKEATKTEKLAALVGCDPSAAAGQDACAEAFIRDFGARAFRRPLEESQLVDYQALYASTKATAGFAVAIELVLRSILQSPYFLYRLEFGAPNPNAAPVVPLTPDETAARLSFLLWGSIPDAELAQAAREGRLGTPAEVRAQAVRMLADDRGRAILSDFHVQWGQLEALPNLTKPAPFTPDLGRLLLRETEEFVDRTLRQGDGLLATLFTSPVSYLNRDLAEYYGVTGPTDSNFVPVTFPAGQRAGLFTQGSFMGSFAHGSESSPVLRGKFILTQVVCSPPQPPPDDVNATLPAPDPSKTARQQLVELTGEGICVGCHSSLNPLGFALEHFDGMGRYRDTERGIAIDSSAEVVELGDIDGVYAGHADFLSALANSTMVRDCLTSKWFIYAHGRIPETDDECSLAGARAKFESTGNVRDLILDMTETPAFLNYRAGVQ